MPIATVNGAAVHYESDGQGTPLLLIPGEGFGAWAWFRQVPAIKRLAQVVVFDPRCSGQDYSVETLAHDCVGLLQTLSIPKAAVCGLDTGGFVAMQLAFDRPELVSRLILAATAPSGDFLSEEARRLRTEIAGLDPEIQFRHELGLMVAPGFTSRNPGLLDTIVEMRRKNPVDVTAGRALREAFMAWSLPGAITVPTLALAGQDDRYQRAETLDRLPATRLERISQSGHLPNIERPEAFNRLLMNFVFEELYPSGGARRGV